MKLREKWEKQNNSVKLLLKKLKRHDTMVVAVAVVIALVLCGGLIYLSTPVVAASAKEEFAESEKESKQQTNDKLDELHEYLSQLDKSISDSQEGLDSFYKLTKEDKSNETITEKVATIGGNLKEIQTSVTSTQTQLQELKELIESNNGENSEKITKEFNSVTQSIKDIQTSFDKAQGDNKALLGEIKELIDKNNTDMNKTLSDKFDSLDKKLTELDNAFSTNIDQLINETNSKLEEMLSITDKGFTEVNNNTNNKFNELNISIAENFEKISDVSNDSFSGIMDYLTGEINGINGKLDQVFQRVSDGKKLLASALLTKGVTINEDATFAQFSEAIRNIPQQIVLDNGDIAGKVEYEYHFHTDGTGNECNDQYVSEDRKGGCYTESYYHKHTSDCYSTRFVYKYWTSESTNNAGYLYDVNGEAFFRWHCDYCGYDKIGHSPDHFEYAGSADVVRQRNGHLLDVETKRDLRCGKREGQLMGYRASCGYVHGQVVTAHITFGPDYSSYDHNLPVTNVETSHMAVENPGQIDIGALLGDFDMEKEADTSDITEEGGITSETEKTDQIDKDQIDEDKNEETAPTNEAETNESSASENSKEEAGACEEENSESMEGNGAENPQGAANSASM